MTAFDRAVFSEPGAGRMAIGFSQHLIHMSAEDTGNTFGLIDADLPAGEGPPLHVHARKEEFFQVLSGRFLFVFGDSRTELDKGDYVLLPRGVPHRFQNIGTNTERLMVVVTRYATATSLREALHWL